MFIFLAFHCFSRKISHVILPNVQIYAMPEFGFFKGGILKISLISSNFTGIKLFALTPIGKEIFYSKANSSIFCSRKVDFFLSPLYPKTQSDSFTWSLEITKKVTVLPIITNCKGAKIIINAVFSNPSTFLDSRETNLQKYYLISAIIYTIFSLTWMINGLTHSKFLIKLHFLFIISCLIKAFTLIICSLEWREEQMYNEVSIQTNILIILFRGISFIYLYTINIIAAFGYNIYRSVSPNELVGAIGISTNLFITLFLCHLTKDSTQEIIFTYIAPLLFFVMFFKFVRYGLVYANHLLEVFDRYSLLNILLKANKVITFNFSFLFTATLLFIVDFAIDVLRVLPSITFFVHEIFELLIYILDFLFFSYRNSYIYSFNDSSNEFSNSNNEDPYCADTLSNLSVFSIHTPNENEEFYIVSTSNI